MLAVKVRGGLCNRLRALLSLAERNPLVCWPLIASGWAEFHCPLSDLWQHPFREITPEEFARHDGPKLETSSAHGPLRLDLFRLHPDRQQEVDQFDHGCPIGVSIRTVRAHPLTLERTPVEWFIARMREHPGPYFLSVDDPGVSARIRGEGIAVVEFPKRGAFNSRRGVQEALIDLYLLARCPKLIGSYYSSYSEFAAALAGVAAAGGRAQPGCIRHLAAEHL